MVQCRKKHTKTLFPVIAGLFGMNVRCRALEEETQLLNLTLRQLHSSLETTPYAFWATSGLAFTLVCVVTVGGLRKVYSLRRIGLGQGVFGDYQTAWSNHAISDIQGRKALYYERSRRKRQEKQERELAKHALRASRYRGN